MKILKRKWGIYASNRETSRTIQQELKDAGIPKKDYRIRVDNYSVEIAIKNPYISIQQVENVVNKYESIDYDEYTGEILSGGNSFVFVRYADDAFDEVAKEYYTEAQIIKDAYNNPDPSGKGVIINDSPQIVYFANDDSLFINSYVEKYTAGRLGKNSIEFIAKILWQAINYGGRVG